MIHVSPKHGVVGVPVNAHLLGIFPDAKRVVFGGNEVMLLPHVADTVRLMRNLNIDIPAPILTQYDWCGGTPFEVQRKTTALLTTARRAYVLNGMGTGKTKAALWAYDYLRGKSEAKRLLVVAPLSTLSFTWAGEVIKTTPHLKVGVLHSYSAEKRLKTLAEPHDVYVINPGGLALIEKELLNRPDIDTLVIDELAQFRNGGAKQTKRMMRIARRMKWAWGMTGSPTPQAPTDAWAQCRILTPDTVPEFFSHFRDKVQYKVTQFKHSNKPDAAGVVINAMRPAVRFTLDDVIELPEVVERTIDLPLNPRQKMIYESLRKSATAMFNNGEITAANAAGIINKLLQVSLGYVYGSDGVVHDLDPASRLDALIDIIDSTDRKVIVFSPFTHAVTGIAARLAKENVPFQTVNGSTPMAIRKTIFPEFQNKDTLKVLNAHPNCMSHGLTLTAANIIVWYGPTTSLEVFEQANARIRRIGQMFRQQIIMMQSSPIERKAYTMLRAKQVVQDNILDLFAANS